MNDNHILNILVGLLLFVIIGVIRYNRGFGGC